MRNNKILLYLSIIRIFKDKKIMSYNTEEEKSNSGALIKALVAFLLLLGGVSFLILYKPY